jgi:hypothetical protein
MVRLIIVASAPCRLLAVRSTWRAAFCDSIQGRRARSGFANYDRRPQPRQPGSGSGRGGDYQEWFAVSWLFNRGL